MKTIKNSTLRSIICDNCKKDFLRHTHYSLKNRPTHYCSVDCYFQDNEDVHPQIMGSHRYADEFTGFRFALRASQGMTRSHLENNIDFIYLAKQWIKQEGKCAYTRIPLTLANATNHIPHTYRASLDRIDSTKGYIKGNVHFVSTSINYMKNNLTHEETIKFIRLIRRRNW